MSVRRIAFLLVLLLSEVVLAAPMIGTMSAEVRDRDKRIDIDRTIDALVQLRVNTYQYLVWQNERDWDDLPAFADAAAQHNIDVWVYIIPWSETPLKKPDSWGFSEPFRTNYVAWSSEIAKLSLRHPNIVGYIIDDFYENTTEDHFTPTYVRRMVDAGRRINPKIQFYPLMYFQTPWRAFVDRFGSTVDGCVICYPKSEAGIRNAMTYLRDRHHGPTALIEFPRHKEARRGDFATAMCEADVVDPDQAEVSFYYDVTDHGRTDTSVQQIFVRVDGKTVWQAPNDSPRMRDGIISVDLSRFVRRPGRVRFEFSVLTIRTGTPDRMPNIFRFDDIRVYGVSQNPQVFDTGLRLRGKVSGKYTMDLMPGSRGGGRYNIPAVIMPCGEPQQYEKRYEVDGTPDLVAQKTRLSLDMTAQGVVSGVVPYRTPLVPGDPYFEALRQEYAAFMNRAPSQ